MKNKGCLEMIAENEIQQLKDSLKKKNEEFSEIVMSFLEKNDFLTDEDLENLRVNVKCCGLRFESA